ncbi:lipopolysaccharide biosynthesis protein [Peribacillus glennii]|uniref:Lipopolysaccharide biosynthesis protein n=1 Tax=Peribacillus glennii TaxID=2303991 RepID=A0A372LFY4_9BACI|nr:oligosaccharide flippase family protein [Peribacillus glennii]RFU64882.1 hypothetical protein D0466_02880 [Peribacillus glennii]
MFLFKNWKRKLTTNHFIKSLSVLMAGTALSNVILAVTTPLMTRLYTPEEFGNLSVFLSILFSVSVIASLLYDSAIPLPEKDIDAFHLFILSSLIVIGMSIVILIVVVFLPVTAFFDVPVLGKHIWLLSLSLLGIGLFHILNAWALRKEDYQSISKAKLIMNGSQISAQIMLGFSQLGLIGLLIGEVMGRIAGTLGYLKLLKKDEVPLKQLNMKELKKVTKRYKSFPLISSWSALLNSLGNQLPTFFLAAHFDPKTAGWFFLAQKILTVPEGLLGFSAQQVYLSQSAQQARASPERFMSFFWDTIKKMFVMGIIVIGMIAFIAPYAVKIVFGQQWSEAGDFLQILSILYLMKIIVNPLSANFYVTEALKYQVISEIIRFLLICLSIFLSAYYFESPEASLTCISLMSSLGYLVNGLFSWYVIKKCFVKTQIGFKSN